MRVFSDITGTFSESFEDRADALRSHTREEQLEEEKERAEALRHNAGGVTSIREKRSLYLEAFPIYGRVLAASPPVGTMVSAANGRGYAAMELGRLAFFEWQREAPDSPKSALLESELKDWIQLYAFPNFYRVISKSDISQGMTAGLARAYAGYSFGLLILADYLGERVPGTSSGQSRRNHFEAISCSSTALKYGLRGLRADPENDHARKAAAQSLACFSRELNAFLPLTSLEEIQNVRSLLSGIRNRLGDLLKATSGVQSSNATSALIADVNSSFEKYWTPIEKVLDARDSLPSLFVQVAKGEKWASLEDFKVLFEAYVEDLSPMLLPEVEQWRYDRIDAAIVRVAASTRRSSWKLSDLTRDVRKIAPEVTLEAVKNRAEDRKNTGWYGLEFEIEDENMGDEAQGSIPSQGMSLGSLEKVLAAAIPHCERLKVRVSALDGWLEAEDSQRLNDAYLVLERRIELLAERAQELRGQGKNPSKKTREEVYALCEGAGKEKGYHRRLKGFEQRLDFHLREPLALIQGLARREQGLIASIGSMMQSANTGESDGFLARAEQLQRRTARLLDQADELYLSKDEFKEINDDLKGLELQVKVLGARLTEWRKFDSSLEKIPESAPSSEEDRLMKTFYQEIAIRRQKLFSLFFEVQGANQEGIKALMNETSHLIRTATKYSASRKEVENLLDEAEMLGSFAVTEADVALVNVVTERIESTIADASRSDADSSIEQVLWQQIQANDAALSRAEPDMMTLRRMHTFRRLETAWPLLSYLAGMMLMERCRLTHCESEYLHPDVWENIERAEELIEQIIIIDGGVPAGELKNIWEGMSGKLSKTCYEALAVGAYYSFNLKFDEKFDSTSEGIARHNAVAEAFNKAIQDAEVFDEDVIEELRKEGRLGRFYPLRPTFLSSDPYVREILRIASQTIVGEILGGESRIEDFQRLSGEHLLAAAKQVHQEIFEDHSRETAEDLVKKAGAIECTKAMAVVLAHASSNSLEEFLLRYGISYSRAEE